MTLSQCDAPIVNGLVTAIRGSQALVRVETNAACGDCAAKCLLSGEKRQSEVWVRGEGLSVNEQVELSMSSKHLVKGATMLYLIPAILFVVFAGVGAFLSKYFGVLDVNAAAILGGVVSIPVMGIVVFAARKKLGGIEVLSISRKIT